MRLRPGTQRKTIGLFSKSFLILTLLLASFVSTTSQPGFAIPAFARKYGLPCSACHIGWPVLNNFGIQFKDNGYQLGNDKDSPIYQNNGYFPITFRDTPQWHLENTNKVFIDQTQTEQSVTTHGFDVSGLDIWTAGTLSKNISFQVLPSMEEGDGFHFEAAWIRFDNLLHSPWLNVNPDLKSWDRPFSRTANRNLLRSGQRRRRSAGRGARS